jgi:GGDEF domain-containing protein
MDDTRLVLVTVHDATVRLEVERRLHDASTHALALSVGGAIRRDGETLATVMRRADEAMYQDKLARRAGRR